MASEGVDVAQIPEQTSSLLQGQKMESLIRLVTRLQAEGHQVMQAKVDLLDLKDQAYASSSLTAERTLNLHSKLQEKKPALEKIITYLKQNNDADAKMPADPLESLLDTGRGELTHAYDELMRALDARETLIGKRLGESLEHFGIKERIIAEHKDFDKELEDIANTFENDFNRFKAEDFVSIQDQV